MSRRSVVAAVIAACVAALTSPATAAVAGGVGTVSIDTISVQPDSQGYARAQTDRSITAASVLSDGSVSLAVASGSALRIRLAGGAPLQARSTYPVGGVNKLGGTCPTTGYGELRVDAVEYSGATLSVLAAAYGVTCTDGGWQGGSIRIASDLPEPEVRPGPVSAPAVGLDTPQTFTADLVNSGTVPTGTLGTPTLDPTIPGSADFSVISDECAGVVLPPQGSCRLTLSFQRGSGGTSRALVKLADPLAPGGRWVVPVSGTAVSPPGAPVQATSFPVAGGVGMTWGRPTTGGFLPTGYRVLRSVAGSAWSDVSGLLPVDLRSWVDTSLPPGSSADYQVVGENLGGRGAPSETVTATRPLVDPSIGTIDAITVDADGGSGAAYSGGTDAVTREVAVQTMPGGSDAVPEIRILQGAGVSVMIPYLLPGPGVFPLPGWWGPSSVSQGHSAAGCGTGGGSLTVREVAYGASLQLTTLSATYRLTCDVWTRPDLSGSLYVELRYKSTEGFAALTVVPSTTQLARVPVGTVSPAVPVTVTNTGLVDQALGTRSLAGDGADAWRITDDTCPATLPAGNTCTVRLRATPASSGRHPVQLVVPDETARGSHHAAADIVGTSLPSPATAVTALRLPSGGVDLSWSDPTDWGGTGAIRYVIHRTSDAGTARFDVPYSYAPTWSDISPPTHSRYAVSMVTEIGEGPPSAAVTPRSVTDYFMTNASADYREQGYLSMIATPGATTAVRLPTKAWAAGLAMSPDGRSLLWSQPGDGGHALWRQAVDGSSAPQRLWTASGARLERPAWSPDGSRIAVASIADSPTPYSLHVLRSTGGAPTLTLPWLSEPAWLPDARTIVAHDVTGVTTALVKVDASTGKRLGTIAGTEGARVPTVSPDGRWIAFKRYSATGTSTTFVIAATGGTARQAPDQVGFSDVDWSPDGSSLAATLNLPYGYSGIYRIPVSAAGTPGTATPISLRVFTRMHAIAWGGGRVAIAPSPALTGRQTTFTINATALAPKPTLTCTVDSGAARACSTSFTTPSLTTGTHTLRVRSVEPGGRVTVAARTFTVDATAPVTSITSLPATLLSGSTTLRYRATDKGGAAVASYDVRYRYATPAGTFTTYRQPSTWQAMHSTSLPLKLTPGYSYCFSARARDSVGNVSTWTTETCTRVALDDRGLTGTGWTRRSSTSYAFGTYSTAAASGRVLAAKVGARQIGLVVTTCPTCGVVDVRLAGANLGLRNLATSTTRVKQIIWLPAGAYRAGTLTITTVGSKRVYIDGVVIRK